MPNPFESQAVFEMMRIAYSLEKIERTLHHAFGYRPATFARLKIQDEEGNTLMPATLAVGKTATALLQEYVIAGGPAIPPIGPVTYASSAPAIATVDPVTGIVTAVAPGTAIITGTDAGNSLSASDTVSDTAPVATVATLTITPN